MRSPHRLAPWPLVAALALAPLGAARGEEKSEVKDAGRTIGHALRKTTRTIGHATRDTVKSIGHGTRDAVKGVGEGLQEGGKDGGKGGDSAKEQAPAKKDQEPASN